jgi:GH15 family glucan-1,4-alpha-glucosidase
MRRSLKRKIEDYAIIGDCQTVALISKTGSMDWLCLPRFDSDACFAALLGTPENGRWLVAPSVPVTKTWRKYRDGSLVLETFFKTESGILKLIDFMPIRTDHPDLIRIAECVDGTVPVKMELLLRYEYGSIRCWLRNSENGWIAVAGPDQIHIKTNAKLERKADLLFTNFTVKEGERKHFIMSYQRSYLPLPQIADPDRALHDTDEFWKEWSSRCAYDGPWKKEVSRSLITVKALVYSPTGGIIAAPTTSLPEKLGGTRNWDYRYCWIRDATFSLYSLLLSGYQKEAEKWGAWLLRAVAGDPDAMQILYGIAGERRIPEWKANWLSGFEKSSPVRIGNAAHLQVQLDVYGELMDSLYLSRVSGLHVSESAWELQIALLKSLAKKWKKPDNGIWEIRGKSRQFTHSKVMAWVAVDRMIKTANKFHLNGPVQEWKTLRENIRKEICEKGFDRKLNSFVQYYGSKRLDGSLLMIPLVGFLEPEDERVKGTLAAIRKDLLYDGFVLRYKSSKALDGLPRGEGVFLPCSFWLVDNLILQNRREEAGELFHRLVGLCNDVGLISEEYDPENKVLLGNFPQAFSHVSLINSAWNLNRKEGPALHRKKQGGSGNDDKNSRYLDFF